MLGGKWNNSNNPMFPVLLDDPDRFAYHNMASNQLQLFGKIPAVSNGDPASQLRIEQKNTHFIRSHKRSREEEEILKSQKLHVSLNFTDQTACPASIRPQNIVSTGLRLSYDDDTSASRRSMSAKPSIILSLADNITNELHRQKEEFDQYIRIQEENFSKGVHEIHQRHKSSFLSAIEKSIAKKLNDKELEVETMNHKNSELVEKIKQLALEAQNWQYRAKYNESIITILKTNLQQAMISQGAAAEQGKEGFGDNDVDDAASYIDLNNYLSAAPTSGSGKPSPMICRSCKIKEVNILLMPCRHLCLCKDCDVLINVCPVCQSTKMAGVQVNYHERYYTKMLLYQVNVFN